MVGSNFSHKIAFIVSKIDLFKNQICCTMGVVGGIKYASYYEKDKEYYGIIGGYGGYIISRYPFLIIPLPIIVAIFSKSLRKK